MVIEDHGELAIDRSSPPVYQGAKHVSQQAGATAAYSFDRSRAHLLSARGPGRGLATVSVAGTPARTIDLDAARRAVQQVVFDTGVLGQDRTGSSSPRWAGTPPATGGTPSAWRLARPAAGRPVPVRLDSGRS